MQTLHIQIRLTSRSVRWDLDMGILWKNLWKEKYPGNKLK
jgi:hypothetical protein